MGGGGGGVVDKWGWGRGMEIIGVLSGGWGNRNLIEGRGEQASALSQKTVDGREKKDHRPNAYVNLSFEIECLHQHRINFRKIIFTKN